MGDAYIPQDNKSAFEVVPGLENIYKERTLKEEGKERLVASYTPEEFGVTNPDDINWALRSFFLISRSNSIATSTGRLPSKNRFKACVDLDLPPISLDVISSLSRPFIFE